MQRMLKVPGTFAPCRTCGDQPKHYHEATHGGLYQLHCCPCDSKTAKFPTHQQAVEAWESMNEVARVAA